MSNLPRETKRLFALQLLMITTITVGLIVFRNINEAVSALLGGAVAILPALLFAIVLFHYKGARAAKKIVNNFYRGEALKIAMSIALFALIFRFYSVTPIVFFVTYAVMALSFGFLLLIFDNKK